ncbi:MAG: hypothetical protein LBB79_07975 [Prevotellaceae bacterium]|jgi:hypothetical protein|nr:hypothetical protein [Prevotellaceae bacterium]
MKTVKIVKAWCAVSIIALIVAACGAAKKVADTDTKQWRYELEAVGVGVQGTYQVKVWSYSKDAGVAIEQAKKNAVHGIIFKGFAGIRGVPSQKPLVSTPSADSERKDFFEPFFADGGGYMKFVNLSNNGAIAPGDRIKIGKEYKIGVVVLVNVAALRKELENAGIVKKLGAI